MNEERSESGSTQSGVGDILMEAASPHIYRLNAFRLLGAHVDASARQISRQSDKINMLKKYGKLTSHAVGALPLDPPPDPDLMRDAIQSLHDPECRIVDEFFWFWPRELGQSQNDQALEPLTRDDIEAAANIWLQWEKSSDSNVSLHNLSVLFHCVALDWEHQALFQPLSAAQKEQTNQYWKHAFSRWVLLLKQEAFWSRVSERIREMDDPRLTTGTARRMRQTLPVALLSINAALAVHAAEKGQMEEAQRQIYLMRESGLGRAAMDEALSVAVKPIRGRIKNLCQNATQHAGKEPAKADREAQQLIEQSEPLLSILDGLLPEDSATREMARDEVAQSALACQIQYGNKTNDWNRSLELLQLTLPVCAGHAIRSRVEENIRIVKKNLEFDLCWFCKKNSKTESASLDIKMYGDVTRTPTFNGTQVRWRTASIKVPRCKSCKSVHEKEGSLVGTAAVFGALMGVGGCMVSASNEHLGWGIAAFLLLTGLGSAIGTAIGAARRPEGVQAESVKTNFPGVKQLLALGWQLGEKPNTQ